MLKINLYYINQQSVTLTNLNMQLATNTEGDSIILPGQTVLVGGQIIMNTFVVVRGW